MQATRAMDSEVSLLISRALSYSVVAICVFMKLPQVLAILKTGDTKGVNLKSIWMEIGAYLIGFSYGYTHGYHLSTYVESGLLAAQSATIVFLVVYYDSKWTIENAVYALVITSFTACSLSMLVPFSVLSILLSLALPLSAGSKLAQIATIYRIQSKGNVSVLTWSLAAYGCFARLFTVYIEVDDMLILFNFLVSAVLNSTVVALCLYYGDGKQRKEK